MTAHTEYPIKPIDFYMSFPIAGSSGKVTHILLPKVMEILGQKIIVKDFKPGKGGNLGAEAAAMAAPDGYSILMGTIGNMALITNILNAYKVKPLRDFIPVTQITETPDILVAHPSLQASTFEELLEYGKRDPGRIKYSPIEPYSIHRIEFEEIMRVTGVEMVWHRDILGSGAAMKALEDGEISLTMSTAPYTLPLVQKGVVKPLAVSAEKRMAQLPDIPTLKELGIDTRGSWMGVFVPSGASELAVDKLFKAFKNAAEYPENKKQIQELGMRVHTSKSPSAFRGFVESETERLAEAAKRANIYVR